MDVTELAPAPALYRLHINTSCEDREGTLQFCLDGAFLGVGWPVECEDAKGVDWAAYEKGAEDWYDGVNPSVRALHDLPDGSLIWTRDTKGVYYLGRVDGPWRYLTGTRAEHHDMHNVRPGLIVRCGVESAVPGKVANAFIARRAFQGIHDDTARRYSASLFADSPRPGTRPSMRRCRAAFPPRTSKTSSRSTFSAATATSCSRGRGARTRPPTSTSCSTPTGTLRSSRSRAGGQPSRVTPTPCQWTGGRRLRPLADRQLRGEPGAERHGADFRGAHRLHARRTDVPAADGRALGPARCRRVAQPRPVGPAGCGGSADDSRCRGRRRARVLTLIIGRPVGAERPVQIPAARVFDCYRSLRRGAVGRVLPLAASHTMSTTSTSMPVISALLVRI